MNTNETFDAQATARTLKRAAAINGTIAAAGLSAVAAGLVWAAVVLDGVQHSFTAQFGRLIAGLISALAGVAP